MELSKKLTNKAISEHIWQVRCFLGLNLTIAANNYGTRLDACQTNNLASRSSFPKNKMSDQLVLLTSDIANANARIVECLKRRYNSHASSSRGTAKRIMAKI